MTLYQPYQEASEEIKRQGHIPLDLLKKAGAVGLSAVGIQKGSDLATKALALVNQYVPENLSIKGLTKLDPRYGTFIKKALSGGASYDEIRDFIGQKAEDGLKEMSGGKEGAKETRNLIEKYDPELHLYIKNYLGKGESLINAGRMALKHDRFKKAIDRITKDHKAPWEAILQTVYGNQGQQKEQQQQPQQFQQPGQGQQALMQMLQVINQKLGK